MAITPEQVKNREFPVRLEGYDPEEVRSFLAEVAQAYRATIRDQGAQWALSNISDDMAAVLRAAHDAAQKVLAQAEIEAEEVRAKAESQAALLEAEADEKTELAVEVLKRSQKQADQVADDCVEARRVLEDARQQAQDIVGAALAEAAGVRVEIGEVAELERRMAEADARLETASRLADEAQAAAASRLFEAEQTSSRMLDEAESVAADRRREATEDREQARILVERAHEKAAALVAEASERASALVFTAEREARHRVQELQGQALEVSRAAEQEARERVQLVLSDGQRRLETLEEEERQLHARILEAKQAFEGVVNRLLASEDTTLDLTDDEPVVLLGAGYVADAAADAAIDGDPLEPGPPPPDPDLVRRVVSAAVGSARGDS